MNRSTAIMAFVLHAWCAHAMERETSTEEHPRALTIFDQHSRETQMNKSNIDNALAACCLSADTTASALRSVQGNDFDRFDAKVGDSACQIRTSQLMDLPQETSGIASLEECSGQLVTLKSEAQRLIRERKFKASSLGDFLTQHNINLSLDDATRFFGQLFFLTASQNDAGLKAIKERYSISPSAAKKLRLSAQRALQNSSNAYIQGQAQTIARDPERSLVLSPACATELAKGVEQIKGSQGRASVPCLFGMQVILEKIARAGQPMVIRSVSQCKNGRHDVRVPFLFDTSSRTFKIIDPRARGMLGRLAMIIRGYQFDGTRAEFDDRFKKGKTREERQVFKVPCHDSACHAPVRLWQKLRSCNIAEVVLANTAAHPQFPGDQHGKSIELDFDQLPHLKRESERLQAIAHKDGMSEQNMSTHLITHIRPDTLGHVLGVSEGDDTKRDTEKKEQ